MPRRTSTNTFIASMCRKSYYDFFVEFWPLTSDEKLVAGWHLRKLCDELQCLAESVFREEDRPYDLIWNCPPGTSKSTAVSILFQPWVWTRMPGAKFITGSHSERLALDLSRKSRDVVVSQKYQALFPDIALRDDQNTKSFFMNTRGGMRYAVGVGGSVLGHHAHFILVDDPIDPQGALSDLVLNEANVWMTETLSRRKVHVLRTPTVLIMQRLHQDDPTGAWLNRGTKVRHCVLPADLNWDVKPSDWAYYYTDDGLLDPIRLSRAALDEALATLGEEAYAGQYGQNPVPRGGAMFKIDRLGFYSTRPDRWKRQPIRYWDKAATLGGGAFTAGVLGGIDLDDYLWVLDCVRGQWDSGTREKIIDQTARLDGRKVRIGVEEEGGSGGKESAEATIRRLILKGFRGYANKPHGDKILRADPFSQWVNQGKVIILAGPWNTAYLEEMRYFPRSKYKDQIDASSGMFSGQVKKRSRIGAL